MGLDDYWRGKASSESPFLPWARPGPAWLEDSMVLQARRKPQWGLVSEVPLQVDVALISAYPSETSERCAKQEERSGGMSQQGWRPGRGSVPRIFISLSSSVSDFSIALK